MSDTHRKKGNGQTGAPEEFKVEDRRHWQLEEDVEPEEEAQPARPTLIDEYRQRTEAAESKLQEYIEAFKEHQRDQDAFRERLTRDVERRVQLQFGEVVAGLLNGVDDLDLALQHTRDVPEAEPLARGVQMARERFLAALAAQGVEPVSPDGEPFDPNVAEAMRVDPVDSPEMDGKVTETLQPGYRIGEHVIRPARVAVGRYTDK